MPSFCRRLKWRKQAECVTEKIPADIYHWLFDSSSLTAKLIHACPGKFTVKLLSQHRARPSQDESQTLNLHCRQIAVIRQVILYCDQQPWVYARTVIPVTTLKGSLRRLVNLGNQPLGAVLFADKSIQRGQVEVAVIKPCHQLLQCSGFQQKGKLWGRRSIFSKQKKNLLVSEFFLPDLLAEKKV